MSQISEDISSSNGNVSSYEASSLGNEMTALVTEVKQLDLCDIDTAHGCQEGDTTSSVSTQQLQHVKCDVVSQHLAEHCAKSPVDVTDSQELPAEEMGKAPSIQEIAHGLSILIELAAKLQNAQHGAADNKQGLTQDNGSNGINKDSERRLTEGFESTTDAVVNE